jgi:DnaJ-class molecular chaperone
VTASATREQIRSAYKLLIKKNHPDRGGSKEYAQQLNAAKDVLLRK